VVAKGLEADGGGTDFLDQSDGTWLAGSDLPLGGLTLYLSIGCKIIVEPMNEPLTIGKVASAAGVNIQTIRYYERRRLLAPASRLESGYRLYRLDALQKLRFIKNAQKLGFSLEEIRSLLQLKSGPAVSCGKVREKAAAHARDIRERIERLMAMEKVLVRLVATCQKRGRTGECPILASLESEK